MIYWLNVTMLRNSTKICLNIYSPILFVNRSRGIAIRAIFVKEFIHKITPWIIINTSICIENKWLKSIRFSMFRAKSIVFDKFKNINVGWHITLFHSFIHTKMPYKFLENDIIICHDLLPYISRQTHHCINNIF